MAYFSEFGISSKFALQQSGTPQHQALLWLADQDLQQLPVPMKSVSSPAGYNAMQRYLLAVSYFQMGGSQWAHRLGFLSGNSTCHWNQQREVTPSNGTLLRGSLKDTNYQRTLGVVCDSSGKVVNLTLRKFDSNDDESMIVIQHNIYAATNGVVVA
jgi:hypothetical protein